jgi:hypothetical protein
MSLYVSLVSNPVRMLDDVVDARLMAPTVRRAEFFSEGLSHTSLDAANRGMTLWSFESSWECSCNECLVKYSAYFA